MDRATATSGASPSASPSVQSSLQQVCARPGDCLPSVAPSRCPLRLCAPRAPTRLTEGVGSPSLSRVGNEPREPENHGGRGDCRPWSGRAMRGERRKGMLDSIRSRLAREEGQALVEYALIISLVAIVTVSVLSLIGTNVVAIFNGAAGSL